MIVLSANSYTTPKMIECRYCISQFKTLEGIDSHVESQHHRKADTAGGYLCYCDQCGGELHKGRSKMPANQFCSRDCYYDYCSSDGDSGYNQFWSSQREKRLELDGHSCVICPAKEEQGVAIDVHHVEPLNPVEKWNNVNEAHQINNLVSLCRSCHKIWENRSPERLKQELREED